MNQLPLRVRFAARAIARRPLRPIGLALVLSIGLTAVGVIGAATFEVAVRAPDYARPHELITIRAAGDLLDRNDVAALRGGGLLRDISVFEQRYRCDLNLVRDRQ